MNEKFFSLPKEKQQSIINAGYNVFSQNSYRKSPMSEIADAAGISKSLLFHYFRNKKELYLYLWDEGARITIEYMTRHDCYEKADLFEMMERSMKAKLEIMRIYPNLATFTLKAFYEKDPEVHDDIQKSYAKYFSLKAQNAIEGLDPNDFVPGTDLRLMYREMYWTSIGYMWEMMQQGEIDANRLEKDFSDMLAFWKRIFLKQINQGDGSSD